MKEEKFNQTLKNSIRDFFSEYANYKLGLYSMDIKEEKYKEAVLDALSILVMSVSKELGD